MEKWNNCVDHAVNRLPYAFSWYLDTVCHGWDALVSGDYHAVFPLTGRKKFTIHYLYQPAFTQQLGIFSRNLLTAEMVNGFLNAIPSKYRLIEINLNKFNAPDEESFDLVKNVNLELSLISSYDNIRSGYSKNLKRNLKKAESNELAVIPGVNPVEVIRMFQLNRGKQVNSLSKEDYLRLEQLIYKMSRRGKAEVRGVFTERNSLCAAAVFLKLPDRIIFLFSGLNDEGRQAGAMPYLIDNVIRQYSGRNMIFDFEGSNDQNLARFYRGFGAEESYYPALRINRMPGWKSRAVDWMKKIR
jgi:hypothetical protein